MAPDDDETQETPTLSARKRAAILTAAAEVFRDEGFHVASMDRVAERAGVSKRTVYNHFESKDVLFDAVIESFWQRLVPGGAAAVPGPEAPVVDRLRALALARLDVLLDPALVGLMRAVLADSVRAPRLQRAYRADHDHLGLLGIGEVLREEAQRGRLQITRPELAAQHFWGLTIEALFWPVVLGFRAPARAAERRLVVEEGVATFLARYGKAPARRTPAVAAAAKRPPSDKRPRPRGRAPRSR